MKFKLHDIRESKVWKEAYEEGKAAKRKELIEKWSAKEMALEQIAELLGIPIEEVQRLSKSYAHLEEV